MKTSFKLLIATCLVLNLTALSSCEKEPTCKQCSAEQVIYQNGTETGRQTISAIEYCDEALEELEKNSSVETNQNIGTISQRTVTTYTCN